MGRRIDFSISLRTRQYIVVGIVSAWLVPLLGAVLQQMRVPPVPAVSVAAIAWLVVTVTWVRRWSGSDDGSIWDVTPRSQYGGRFAGGGGLVREEQEDALGTAGEDD